jgi:hypothetical protein
MFEIDDSPAAMSAHATTIAATAVGVGCHQTTADAVASAHHTPALSSFKSDGINRPSGSLPM